jgi:hypothetical protein
MLLRRARGKWRVSTWQDDEPASQAAVASKACRDAG